MNHKSQKTNKIPAEIDEAFIMSMMAKTETDKPFLEEETVRQPIAEQASDEFTQGRQDKRETRKKKTVSTDYESLFIRLSSTMARNGKSVYIRPEWHERITRIVQTVGNNQISLTDYLDNVLTHHFEMFEENIIESYNKKQKPII